VLKAQKGGVNVFALANDEQHQVKYCIIDETLFKHEFWAFHPMDNSATVEVSRESVLKFLEEHKIEVKQLNLTEALEAPQEKK
jgi:prolyl-tRNA synthetase